jgi:hypothetical protein
VIPLDLVRAAPWDRALFTTFALSLAFFEAVLLDSLMRGGSKQAVILTDPEGLRSALSEHGARRAGRDYEIEPVGCTTGCFHPKIGAFVAGDDAHLLVGSGNLSFGGWGGNLECIDHLHPSFAGQAFDDAADFFELMTIADTLVLDADDACLSLAGTLRRAAAGRIRDGRIRIAHSLGDPIATQLEAFADELGGAVRLTAVSPFYDLDGSGVDRLARELGCQEIMLHVHPDGAVRGTGAIEWPFDCPRPLTPVRLEKAFPGDARPLHAKCFEIQCRRGAIRVAGSANATCAGLFGRNVEASVVRILPRFKQYWTAIPAEMPIRRESDGEDEEADAERRVGVLRVTLDADRLTGRIITPRLTGAASAALETFAGITELGTLTIDGEGRFEIAAPGLEAASFEHGRLILRLIQGERVAEGIVAIAAASELIRRIGAMAPRIMAMLAGSETPADVAAILAWFRDDPGRLPSDTILSGGGGDGSEGLEAQPTFVSLPALSEAAAQEQAQGGHTARGQAAWRSAMAMLRAAFRTKRSPWASGAETDDDDDDDPSAREERARDEEKNNKKTMRAFDELLPIMLAPERDGRDAPMALELAHFLASRIRPAPAHLRQWLGFILPQIKDLAGAEGPLAIAAAIAFHATDGRPDGPIRARRYLAQRGADSDRLNFAADEGAAFVEILGPQLALDGFADEIRASRTVNEQVASYVAAANGTGPRDGYPLLQSSPHWPRLARGLDDPSVYARFVIPAELPKSCPRCNIGLSVASREDLRETGVTRCCAIILNGAP